MLHHTKDKGDIALTQAIADLTTKEYYCFLPLAEHLPFDLIAYKDGYSYRIQSKYSTDGGLPDHTCWSDKTGNHTKYYKENDFDYYAIYSPSLHKVMYPSIRFAGASMRYTVPDSATPFYWWEDFLSFTDLANKKTFKFFDKKITHASTDASRQSAFIRRKVQRPSSDELKVLLWSKPMTLIAKDFLVSDKTISKWARAYGIDKPPVGHWLK